METLKINGTIEVENKTLVFGNSQIENETKYYRKKVEILKETEKALLLNVFLEDALTHEIWIPKSQIFLKQLYYKYDNVYESIHAFFTDKYGFVLMQELQTIFDNILGCPYKAKYCFLK